MKIVRRVFVSGVLLVVGVGGCASFCNEAQNRRVLGVIVDQLVLVDGAAGKGVSVGVGAAGGSGGGSVFGLGVSVDLGQVFGGGERRVTTEYRVRLDDGRMVSVRDAGEALENGRCVALTLDHREVARSIRPAVGCKLE